MMDQAAMQTVTVEDQTSAVVVSAHHLGECGLAWNPSPVVAGEWLERLDSVRPPPGGVWPRLEPQSRCCR